MKPIFVLITAADCPACIKFKKFWPNLKASLNSYVEIVEKETPSVRSSLPADLPTDIRKVKSPWYPIMFLVNRDDWRAAQSSPSHPLRMNIYGTDFVNGDYVINQEKMKISKDGVYTWVLSEIKNPKFSSIGTPVITSRNNPIKPGEVKFISTCKSNLNIQKRKYP